MHGIIESIDTLIWVWRAVFLLILVYSAYVLLCRILWYRKYKWALDALANRQRDVVRLRSRSTLVPIVGIIVSIICIIGSI